MTAAGERKPNARKNGTAFIDKKTVTGMVKVCWAM
jgi:hypothetical protein